jgi:putrescine aminotransferase
MRAAGWLEEKILAIGADKVAAFIGEPVQGAGGVIIPPATYWPEIQRICDKYGILLVSDEVICGFGRTGHWFGCETMGYKPDLMTFAKGVTSGYIPLGGVMVGDRVAKVLIEQGRRVQPRLHLQRAPGGLRRGAGQPGHDGAEQLPQRVRGDIGPTLPDATPNSMTTRWSGRNLWLCGGTGAGEEQADRRAFQGKTMRWAWSAVAIASATG